MEEENIDIYKKYRHEITKINNTLIDLENQRVYEIQKTPGVPKCSTLANRLREQIVDLLDKVNSNEEGFEERAARLINGIKFSE